MRHRLNTTIRSSRKASGACLSLRILGLASLMTGLSGCIGSYVTNQDSTDFARQTHSLHSVPDASEAPTALTPTPKETKTQIDEYQRSRALHKKLRDRYFTEAGAAPPRDEKQTSGPEEP